MKIEKQIQHFANKFCRIENIPQISIKYTNKTMQGRAYYASSKYKGCKTICPKHIMIGEWAAIRPYPDEWAYVLAHELSHHYTAMTLCNIRHNRKHQNIAEKIEQQLIKLFN